MQHELADALARAGDRLPKLLALSLQREYSGIRTEHVLTPAEFLWAMLELVSVERTPCLSPSDRMSSHGTQCPPTGKHLVPQAREQWLKCPQAL